MEAKGNIQRKWTKRKNNTPKRLNYQQISDTFSHKLCDAQVTITENEKQQQQQPFFMKNAINIAPDWKQNS